MDPRSVNLEGEGPRSTAERRGAWTNGRTGTAQGAQRGPREGPKRRRSHWHLERRYRGRARERGSRARACRCTARGRPTRRAPPERGGGVPARGPCCGLALEVGARQRGANTELWRAGARAENRQQGAGCGARPRPGRISEGGGVPSLGRAPERGEPHPPPQKIVGGRG
ncbi:unnamed protein product [Prorocentrum cordatum]|uniref:Uncharacterized protein n=1 Tax=Prorocentrum cordatum TaxID=2364126 RepID=A0ABN9U8U0_9DINO|nr:unnamed protein product [Polarella glacialis]